MNDWLNDWMNDWVREWGSECDWCGNHWLCSVIMALGCIAEDQSQRRQPWLSLFCSLLLDIVVRLAVIRAFKVEGYAINRMPSPFKHVEFTLWTFDVCCRYRHSVSSLRSDREIVWTDMRQCEAHKFLCENKKQNKKAVSFIKFANAFFVIWTLILFAALFLRGSPPTHDSAWSWHLCSSANLYLRFEDAEPARFT